MDITSVLNALGIEPTNNAYCTGSKWSAAGNRKQLTSISPVDGKPIAQVEIATEADYDTVVAKAQEAFKAWRLVPAPQRGEVVRRLSEQLRMKKKLLGALVSYEMGKSLQEGMGEVQEMIDICDFAQGLSRQLYGLTMHSERPQHRMYEQYHPLGVVGIISAFNFPVAVWSWNLALALVCGNVCIWKPSEKTPLVAIACQKIMAKVCADHNVPEGVCSVIIGEANMGEALAGDKRVALISATGSTRMGKAVAVATAARLGKSILELGGNNAVIISQHADLDKIIPAVVFGAVGTAGQRCTSTRRLIIHESVYEYFTHQLVKAYAKLKIGDPMDEANHLGPLIDRAAVTMYSNALSCALKQGAKELVKGGILSGPSYQSGCYVKPAVFEAKNHYQIVQTETFAPILYVMKYNTLEEAIAFQNGVPQGLSSAIMTNNVRESELFLSQVGSDCGIANVNLGTSGAEIGGAFGGEKETGGGRESGSDAWKAYMRRQTNTINFSGESPLAQGIKFHI